MASGRRGLKPGSSTKRSWHWGVFVLRGFELKGEIESEIGNRESEKFGGGGMLLHGVLLLRIEDGDGEQAQADEE